MHKIAQRSFRILNIVQSEKWMKPTFLKASKLTVVLYDNKNRCYSNKKEPPKDTSEDDSFNSEERSDEDKSYALITQRYFQFDQKEKNKKNFEGRLCFLILLNLILNKSIFNYIKIINSYSFNNNFVSIFTLVKYFKSSKII